jgi:hypothetical protein
MGSHYIRTANYHFRLRWREYTSKRLRWCECNVSPNDQGTVSWSRYSAEPSQQGLRGGKNRVASGTSRIPQAAIVGRLTSYVVVDTHFQI